MYHPKVEIKKKNHQSKIELQERIIKREREREPSPFLQENVWQITKLYKRRWVEEYSKENV